MKQIILTDRQQCFNAAISGKKGSAATVPEIQAMDREYALQMDLCRTTFNPSGVCDPLKCASLRECGIAAVEEVHMDAVTTGNTHGIKRESGSKQLWYKERFRAIVGDVSSDI